ncbi:MAG: recombinase family protein [Clostridiales bacterium]|jgi:DNA invertase Pin-like site-specific DNA recombinase|nr:recombinase family protein [Clostridiales bacterium]
MKEYAYVRVSTKEQQDCRQLVAMESRGIPPERIFSEKLSGKNTNRPALQALMDTVAKGDTVVVESISRFARNTKDLLNLVERLTKKGVEFVSLKEYLDTTTPTGRFMLTIFAAVAELERECTLQRQAEGIAVAKSKGVRFGRPPMERPRNSQEYINKYRLGEISLRKAADALGIPKSTFERWANTD